MMPDSHPYNRRVLVVDNLREMLLVPFNRDMNCVLYDRVLEGNFDALAARLGTLFNLPATGGSKLADRRDLIDIRQSLNPVENAALSTILSDMNEISLTTRPGRVYPRLFIRVEKGGHAAGVSILHADGGPEARTFENTLCNYNGPATEWVTNEDALPSSLSTQFFDLRQGGVIRTFGIGSIWRQACTHQGAYAPPFVHRTPPHAVAGCVRLLLTAAIF